MSYMSVSDMAALPAAELLVRLHGDQPDLFGEWLDNVDDDESAKALRARVRKAVDTGYLGFDEHDLFAMTYKGRDYVEARS